MILPLAVFGNNYKYSKVISLDKGSDNFSFDHIKELDNAGKITVDDNSISIDGKKYELKADQSLTNTENVYKSKKCTFELVYKEGELAMVKVMRYNQTVCYVITGDKSLATNK